MATYNFSKAGTGILISEAVAGAQIAFSQPVFDVRPDSMASKNYTGGMLLIKQGASSMQIAWSEIGTINGVVKGADVAAVIGQLNVMNTLVNVKPQLSGGVHIQQSTHATTGATFVAFPAQACLQVTVFNNTGVDLEVQQDGAGIAFPIPQYMPYTFFGLTNASQLGIRRVDTVATAVTLKARCES